jgi:hypothetical protein
VQADQVKNELAAGGIVNGFQLGVDVHHSLENVSRSTATIYNFNDSVSGVSMTPQLRAEGDGCLCKVFWRLWL